MVLGRIVRCLSRRVRRAVVPEDATVVTPFPFNAAPAASPNQSESSASQTPSTPRSTLENGPSPGPVPDVQRPAEHLPVHSGPANRDLPGQDAETHTSHDAIIRHEPARSHTPPSSCVSPSVDDTPCPSGAQSPASPAAAAEEFDSQTPETHLQDSGASSVAAESSTSTDGSNTPHDEGSASSAGGSSSSADQSGAPPAVAPTSESSDDPSPVKKFWKSYYDRHFDGVVLGEEALLAPELLEESTGDESRSSGDRFSSHEQGPVAVEDEPSCDPESPASDSSVQRTTSDVTEDALQPDGCGHESEAELRTQETEEADLRTAPGSRNCKEELWPATESSATDSPDDSSVAHSFTSSSESLAPSDSISTRGALEVEGSSSALDYAQGVQSVRLARSVPAFLSTSSQLRYAGGRGGHRTGFRSSAGHAGSLSASGSHMYGVPGGGGGHHQQNGSRGRSGTVPQIPPSAYQPARRRTANFGDTYPYQAPSRQGTTAPNTTALDIATAGVIAHRMQHVQVAFEQAFRTEKDQIYQHFGVGPSGGGAPGSQAMLGSPGPLLPSAAGTGHGFQAGLAINTVSAVNTVTAFGAVSGYGCTSTVNSSFQATAVYSPGLAQPFAALAPDYSSAVLQPNSSQAQPSTGISHEALNRRHLPQSGASVGLPGSSPDRVTHPRGVRHLPAVDSGARRLSGASTNLSRRPSAGTSSRRPSIAAEEELYRHRSSAGRSRRPSDATDTSQHSQHSQHSHHSQFSRYSRGGSSTRSRASPAPSSRHSGGFARQLSNRGLSSSATTTPEAESPTTPGAGAGSARHSYGFPTPAHPRREPSQGRRGVPAALRMTPLVPKAPAPAGGAARPAGVRHAARSPAHSVSSVHSRDAYRRASRRASQSHSSTHGSDASHLTHDSRHSQHSQHSQHSGASAHSGPSEQSGAQPAAFSPSAASAAPAAPASSSRFANVYEATNGAPRARARAASTARGAAPVPPPLGAARAYVPKAERGVAPARAALRQLSPHALPRAPLPDYFVMPTHGYPRFCAGAADGANLWGFCLPWEDDAGRCCCMYCGEAIPDAWRQETENGD